MVCMDTTECFYLFIYLFFNGVLLKEELNEAGHGFFICKVEGLDQHHSIKNIQNDKMPISVLDTKNTN